MKHLFSLPIRLVLTGMVFVIASVMSVSAQRKQATVSPDDYVYWGSAVAYLNAQAKVAYPLIDKMLEANPPMAEVNNQRRLALVTLDQFLHDAEYNRRTAFYSFVTDRMARATTKMEERVPQGIRVFKLYNSGFVIKTQRMTVAVDVVPGGTSKAILNDSIIMELVDRCDLLLVTNSDSRHANRSVAKSFVDAGKMVYAPAGLWTNLGEGVEAIGADTVQTMTIDGMTLYVLPGHNGNAKNNVYVMDFTGSGVVAHTGAQDNDGDWAWIDKINEQYKVDILLTKGQSIQLESMLRGFAPKMVITSHENEMESGVDRRESYWATQKRMQSLAELGIPNVVMTWGEVYDTTGTLSGSGSSSASKRLINGVLYIERKGSVYTPAGVKVK